MTIMKPEDFARLLRALADSVESGDSLEGSLQYTYDKEGFQIEASLRTGNQLGQGGVMLL